MAFFPYWNLNLQMLAAQQQAAVLAQLSPRMREQLQQQNQQQSDNEEEEQDDEYERKSVDSAMDLSQGTPVKEEEQQQQPQQQQPLAMNLKVEEEATPLMSSSNASRRKGRVLKLDTLLQLRSEAMTSPEQLKVPSSSSMPTASSPIAGRKPMPEEHCSGTSSADESMETANVPQANTSASSTASSSGNSSNASSNSNANSSSNSSSNGTTSAVAAPPSGTPAAAGAIYECKYCDIFFKDAVLYTIHMGYHSCDDVFKCNMCGEKCDGPVGLFVHMARNAHS